jgi:Protein of unknown function (DUF1353)
MTRISERSDVRATDRVPEEAIGFPDGPLVDVREIDDKNWRVLKAFDYQAERERFTVPEKELTDFASVPRIFVWFIPTYGRYTKAAILHDYLCRLAKQGRFSRRDADAVFRQAMRSLGVAFVRRWVMWAAVRWPALLTPEGRRDWLRDAWLVVPISVPVLVIVAPAAIVIIATLLVWFVTEVVVWVPLALVRRFKKQRGMPAKKVNMPQFTYRV